MPFHESLGFAMESACAFCNRLHTEPTVLGSVWCSGSLPQISFTEELDQQESQKQSERIWDIIGRSLVIFPASAVFARASSAVFRHTQLAARTLMSMMGRTPQVTGPVTVAKSVRIPQTGLPVRGSYSF